MQVPHGASGPRQHYHPQDGQQARHAHRHGAQRHGRQRLFHARPGGHGREAARPLGARRRSRRWRRHPLQPAASAPPSCRRSARPDDAFDKQAPRWQKAVEAGLKTVDNILTMAATKGALTPTQEAKVRAFKNGPSEAPAAAAPTVTTPRWPRSCTPRRTSRPRTTSPASSTPRPTSSSRPSLTQIYEARAADLCAMNWNELFAYDKATGILTWLRRPGLAAWATRRDTFPWLSGCRCAAEATPFIGALPGVGQRPHPRWA